MTIRRLRQVVAAINERRKAESREQAALVEWSTRSLAQFIAATVPMGKGKKNKLLEQAQALSLLKEPEGVEGAAAISVDPVERAAAKNAQGSYEYLAQGFQGR